MQHAHEHAADMDIHHRHEIHHGHGQCTMKVRNYVNIDIAIKRNAELSRNYLHKKITSFRLRTKIRNYKPKNYVDTNPRICRYCERK
jgi:hypothetical protein